MNNFPLSFMRDSFQPRDATHCHDLSHVFFLRTSTHEDAVAWGFIAPVKSTVLFLKVQESSSEEECKRLLKNAGVDISTFVSGRDIKAFCQRKRSNVEIATLTGTGYYRVITIVWSPKGCKMDPMRGGNTMEQFVERQFGKEIGFARKVAPFQVVGKAIGAIFTSGATGGIGDGS
ncbi:MAG: hypothetical protein M1839_009292 [Geoglossum umbratile]|nr:MAG: hypothetical protein M1839_009292 [Geoglossum umbratile]